MTANHLQRWAIILSAYDYAVKYQPSAQHGNADGLSCLPLPEVQPTQDDEVEIVCALEEQQFQALPIRQTDIKAKTRCYRKFTVFVLEDGQTAVHSSSQLSCKSTLYTTCYITNKLLFKPSLHLPKHSTVTILLCCNILQESVRSEGHGVLLTKREEAGHVHAL